jgi:hypothetical protein
MADTTYWYTYYNTPQDDQILEFILRQYEILWGRYKEGRRMLQQQQSASNDHEKHKQLVEVSFDDLSQRPVETVNDIYEQLGWAKSSSMQNRLQEIVQNDVMKYKKNSHMELDPMMKSTIQKRWGESFDLLGYEK